MVQAERKKHKLTDSKTTDAYLLVRKKHLQSLSFFSDTLSLFVFAHHRSFRAAAAAGAAAGAGAFCIRAHSFSRLWQCRWAASTWRWRYVIHKITMPPCRWQLNSRKSWIQELPVGSDVEQLSLGARQQSISDGHCLQRQSCPRALSSALGASHGCKSLRHAFEWPRRLHGRPPLVNRFVSCTLQWIFQTTKRASLLQKMPQIFLGQASLCLGKFTDAFFNGVEKHFASPVFYI